jgi:hypothetical protein
MWGGVCVYVGVVVCQAPSFVYPQGRVWSKGSHFPVLEVRILWLNQVTQLCVVHTILTDMCSALA